MMPESLKAAHVRMDQRYRHLLALCDGAYGVGACVGYDPDPEAAVQLGALLDAPISDEERADLELVGRWADWRRDIIDWYIPAAREMAEGDIRYVTGPAPAPVDPNAGPQARH